MEKKRPRLVDVLALGVGIFLVFVVISRFAWSTSDMELVAGHSRVEPTFLPRVMKNQRDAFAEWSASPDHFGAFAIGRAGEWGSSWGYNDPAAAERSAIAACGEGAECRVVAHMRPVRAAEEGQLVVSRSTYESFERYFGRRGAKAFAVSEAGEVGWTWGFSTPWQAQSRAVARCREEVVKKQGSVQDASCLIVHSRWW